MSFLDKLKPLPRWKHTDPAVRLETLSQEHGVIRPTHPCCGGGMALQTGDRVRILPNHSCLVSSCFERLYLVEGSSVADIWTVHRTRSG